MKHLNLNLQLVTFLFILVIIFSCNNRKKDDTEKSNIKDSSSTTNLKQGATQINSNNEKQTGLYLISGTKDEKVFFYDEPEISSVRNGYISTNEVVDVLKVSNWFGYVEFENLQGQVSKGWILLNSFSKKISQNEADTIQENKNVMAESEDDSEDSETENGNYSSNGNSFVGTWVEKQPNGTMDDLFNTSISIKKTNSGIYEIKCKGNCFGSLMEFRESNGELRSSATVFGNNVILKYSYDRDEDAIINQNDNKYYRYTK